MTRNGTIRDKSSFLSPPAARSVHVAGVEQQLVKGAVVEHPAEALARALQPHQRVGQGLRLAVVGHVGARGQEPVRRWQVELGERPQRGLLRGGWRKGAPAPREDVLELVVGPGVGFFDDFGFAAGEGVSYEGFEKDIV
jgi:hypothetical protein